MDSNNILKCRKCGGQHLTIKCGKDTNKKDDDNTNKKDDDNTNKKDDDNTNKKDDTSINRDSYNRDGYNKDRPNRDGYNKDRPNRDGYNKDRPNRDDYNKDRPNRDGYNKDTYNRDRQNKVKIDNLPSDITKDELFNLLEEWGIIRSINLKKTYEGNTAYIEFQDNKQSNYFIEALDNTPFEYQIIKVALCN